MGIFDTPSRLVSRDYGDIYRQKADRLHEEGRHLLRLRRHEEAEEKVRQLISVQSKVIGERHPEYASSLSLLAEILLAQDELSDAETLLQRSLEIRKKSLGEQHPDYATSLDLLARLMMRWEDHVGAEPLLRKALEIRSTVLGVDHPDYASSLALLADVVSKSDDFETAEPLLREAIETLSRIRGDSQPEVADAYSNLAQLLIRRGETTEAESLFRQAIEIYRQSHGERHNSYVTNTTNLAMLLQNRGDFQAAEPLWRLLLDMRRQSLGDNHPECAFVLIQLAQILQRQGDLTGAESLYREAASIRKVALGERHPEFATSLTYLASALQRLGDLQGAEPLLRQALAIRKDVLGVRNPEYGTSLMNLALLVQKRGDITWAKMLLKEAVEVRRAIFGENHPDYAHALVSLGEILGQQGEPAKAEAMIRRALEIRGESLGEYHPAYATNLCSLAAVMKKQGDFQEAENLLRRALHIRKEVLGEEHPDFITNLGNLAWLLQRKGDVRGTERLLSHALELRRQLLGVGHPDYQQNLERLEKLQSDRNSRSPAQIEAAASAIFEGEQADSDVASEDDEDSLDDALDSLDGSQISSYSGPATQDDGPVPDGLTENQEGDGEPFGETEHPLNAFNQERSPAEDDEAPTVSDHRGGPFALAFHDFETLDQTSTGDEDSIYERSAQFAETDRELQDAPHEPPEIAFDAPRESESAASDDSWTVPTSAANGLIEPDQFVEESPSDPESDPFDPLDGLEIDSDLSDLGQWPPDDPEMSSAQTNMDQLSPRGLHQENAETDFQHVVDGSSTPQNAEDRNPIVQPDDRDEDRVSLESNLVETPLSEDLESPASGDEDRHESVESSAVMLNAAQNEISGGDHQETALESPLEMSVGHFGQETSAEGSSRPSPLRSDSMNQSSSDLSQELSELSDRFSTLGEKLLAAARQLHAPGTPPSEDLLETIGGCRRDFLEFRQKATGLADEFDVPTPQIEAMNSLQDISTLLDSIAEVELHQSKNEELRRRGISVLDRVLAIQHSTSGEFAPLRECQDLARALRQTLEQSAWKELPAEVEQLTEGEHHFAHLLSLIEDHDDLGDDLWASHHESVSQHFGKPLAAAAARSKLTIPQNSGMALVGH